VPCRCGKHKVARVGVAAVARAARVPLFRPRKLAVEEATVGSVGAEVCEDPLDVHEGVVVEDTDEVGVGGKAAGGERQPYEDLLGARALAVSHWQRVQVAVRRVLATQRCRLGRRCRARHYVMQQHLTAARKP
jgi:hypothetical protein